MTYLSIPVDPTQGQSIERTALDGTIYTLGFRWNSRMAAWLLDVSKADGTPVMYGLPIREGWPVLAPYQGTVAGLPPGIIEALDPTGKHQEPTDSSLGVTIPLLYATAS